MLCICAAVQCLKGKKKNVTLITAIQRHKHIVTCCIALKYMPALTYCNTHQQHKFSLVRKKKKKKSTQVRIYIFNKINIVASFRFSWNCVRLFFFFARMILVYFLSFCIISTTITGTQEINGAIFFIPSVPCLQKMYGLDILLQSVKNCKNGLAINTRKITQG